ncbi:hypothetical protein L202_02862 [Cryptococcus amylolentus CBS 6039]|uniref:Metal iron transporter n=1 Tax=Cryptococcus amylolentus CBS 6039 TaxID=1295533 RepID=A0A1E3HWJ9_9TREE|nr:hypothetical protein L202_02862 [Cryptococcus amylolentus CBS 6039]ODN80690.1 hypothetical protein L202_02862 [Cryptococcus amylolentus CBS 6039]
MEPSPSTSHAKPHVPQAKQPWYKQLSFQKSKKVFWRHLQFVGPGLVSSVAYIDPGNWATDLEAGADYGYKLLFVVLMAGLAAVVLQLLSVRLGTTTGLSLPAQTRILFLRLKERYPKYRIPLTIGLWSLYLLAELAIIATDLAELLGSAIALHLLFPKLPLFAGVIITAVDVLVVLLFFRSSSGRQGMMFFEFVIVALVLAVFISFMILLKLIHPVWKDVFFGLVPSHTLVKPGALYIGVGIIGATVMPHALFLGSFLAGVDRLNMVPTPPTKKVLKNIPMPSLNPFRRNRSPSPADSELGAGPSCLSRTAPNTNTNIPEESPELGTVKDVDLVVEDSGMGKEDEAFALAQREYEREVRMFDRIRWVDLHLFHVTIDTTLSLLGFALTINSSILTLAGAAYYYNTDSSAENAADLFGAFALIKSYIGNAAAIIFALALLCAGQSASITATLAGQVVSEGFINWKTSPFLRRLVTRLIGVIPAAIVAAAVGAQGINTMLVASQVLLSIVLPTVIFPLVYLCSKADLMTVQGPEVEDIELRSVDTPALAPSAEQEPVESSERTAVDAPTGNDVVEPVSEGRRSKSYVSPKWVTVLGYALFGLVVLANGYVIIELCLGNG